MWPIFFHIESHLWILYLFFGNGLLIHFCLRGISSSYTILSRPLEAQVLASFFLSISLNGLVLLVADYGGLSFSIASWVLPLLSIIAVFFLRRIIRKSQRKILCSEFSFPRMFLYLIVFMILFYNGGMIEQTTDAWWHMSLANKIALGSSFETEYGHLTGSRTRSYPSLWHGNLALLKTLSGISLPVIWNSFTAWGAVIKLMAFYLFSFGLTRDRNTAFMAAVFFILLPGIGNSYLRVSAWPSHVSYTAWFSMFYVAFSILEVKEKYSKQLSFNSSISVLSGFLKDKVAIILAFCVLIAVVFFSHRSELLWFALAWLAYWSVLSIRSMVLSDAGEKLYENIVSKICYRLLLLILLGFSAWFLFQKVGDANLLSLDYVLAYSLPIVVLCTLISVEFLNQRAFMFNISLLIVCAVLILGSINFIHLYSLFDSSYALPSGTYHEKPLVASGLLGANLALPSWHLQLREGLLYSGILSLPLSLFAIILRPNSTSLFIFGCSLMAFMFCISPYLYQWLQDILSYHSPWRIAILIFHPLLYATLLSDAKRLWSRA